MVGTLVNTGAIVVGSVVGLALGERMPERIKAIVMQALGLAVIVMGLQMALSSKNLLPAVACLLLGGITGEALAIERRLENLGDWLRTKLRSGSERFVEGFVSATLLYLTGAMMIVGSIQDGTVGDSTTLFIKSILDGVASIALASSLGGGVMFAAVPVLLVQGAITLLAAKLLFLSQPAVLEAVTITGGILIFGIGINLLEIARVHIGNLIPSVFYAIIGALLL